jgi:hypothetical protein
MRGSAEFVELVEYLMAQGCTDGLPVVPPLRPLVDRMVEASGRRADEVLGVVPPRNTPATVELVAANAVMAGCRPEYMPVVLAAVEAVLDPAFNLQAVACTTAGPGLLVIVNGPVRNRIGINCRERLFGPGNRANATIGRVLRLLLINLGGSLETDRSTFGHPGQYTYCIGEDEEESPWAPFHVDQGYAAHDSVVTVMACRGPSTVGYFDPDGNGKRLLLAIADAMSPVPAFGPVGYTEYLLLIGPEHRAVLAREGWSKAEIRSFLREHARRRAADFRAIGDNRKGGYVFGEPRRWVEERDPDDRWVHLIRDPADVHILSAGGAAGAFSVLIGVMPRRLSTWQSRRVREAGIVVPGANSASKTMRETGA